MARKTKKAVKKRSAKKAKKTASKRARQATKPASKRKAKRVPAPKPGRRKKVAPRAGVIGVATPNARPTLHLIKLSVGTEDIADLERWQRQRLAKTGRLWHRTRMLPKRVEELLAGGSIYWVIRGLVRCRQRLTAIERVADSSGRPDTHLLLEPELVPVLPTPYRAFQGWRYLEPKDAPPDLAGAAEEGDGLAEMPPEMLAELRLLGLV